MENQGKNRLQVLGSSAPQSIDDVPYTDSNGKKVAFVTLGCSKNTVDSEVMMGVLGQNGYQSTTSPEDADMIVVNTCAFLESAVEEGIDTVLDMGRYKEQGKCKKLVVSGCMVERYRDELKESLPEVDSFISTQDILSVAGGPIESRSREDLPYFLYDDLVPRTRSTPDHYAYIKVSEGCNRPCTFCIIPKIRGKLRSRTITSVAKELDSLLDQQVKEINLVAQDMTSYGSDLDGGQNVAALLQELDNRRDEEYWVRLFYAYPLGTDENLVKTIRDSRNICSYFDMPLQHISGSVLRSMRRPLGEKKTRQLIENIKIWHPEMHLRTTFVVGFPGETEADVDALESFIKEGHFTHAGVFTYSQEKEAGSYHFDNQIDEETKAERRARLMEAQQEVVLGRQESLVGSLHRALFEGMHPESDMLWAARTAFQGPEDDGQVIINDVVLNGEICENPAMYAEKLQGQFVDIEITEAAGYDLVAELHISGELNEI